MNAAGRPTLLMLSVLGVLCVAWGAYSRRSEDSGPNTGEPPATRVTRGYPTTGAPEFPAHPFAPVSMRSEQQASQRANPQTPERRAAPDELLAPCTDPESEQAVPQALDEPDNEARYQRLQQALGSGAEVPVERMREALVTDPSDRVRELALTALTQHPDASPEEIRAVAEGALANPSLAVRAQAERILEQMNELERMDRESHAMEQPM